MWGEREAMVMVPPPTHDSAVSPCVRGCQAFLHRHFPPQSPPSHPLDPSLHSQQQPSPWDCSPIPKLQLSATAPSRGPVSLSRVCMAVARTVWFSFRLGCHRSAVSLSALNVSPLTQTVAPVWATVEIGPLLQFHHPARKGPVLILLFFPLVPSSYQVLHGSISSFPLIRYSYLLSAAVLHAFLCLKLYSWCICGERCTLHLSTPLPSCSLPPHGFINPEITFPDKMTYLLILRNMWRESHKTLRGNYVYLYFIRFWTHWNWAVKIILLFLVTYTKHHLLQILLIKGMVV